MDLTQLKQTCNVVYSTGLSYDGFMLVLGIETSCDETAVAIVENGTKIITNVVYSQIAIHRPYGGVVPEIASRKHIETILPLLEQALYQKNIKLSEIDVIAVTQGPGLVGALLVGICIAKAIAFALNKPLVAINHLEAHLTAIFLEQTPLFPFIGLVVSGGHTNLYLVNHFLEIKQLGQTLDDAAGEAFDKVAHMLGLPYPGGISIEKRAKEGSPNIKFPRPLLNKNNYHFSFSGLKTAVANYLRHHPSFCKADVAASFQQAVVDTLVTKAMQAVKAFCIPRLVVAGGVAANGCLREKLLAAGQREKVNIYFPSPTLCTDNAAMVAALGYHHFKAHKIADFDFDAISRYPVCPFHQSKL